MIRRLGCAVAVAAVCLSQASCGLSRIQTRGNLPDPEKVSELKPGKVTKDDILDLLGSPSSVNTFGKETWYYISAVTTQFAFYSVEEVERDIYALSFDERGILQEVKTYGLDDAEDIQVVQRETPTMGRDYSLIEQLIGNLGRFDRGAPEAGP